MKFTLRLKGGPGSGHFGHKGRPGHKGGSLPKDGQASAVQSSNPSSPKTKSGWIERLASKRSLWNLSEDEFTEEVYDTLIEKFPEFQGGSDELTDLVQSAVNQRRENMNEEYFPKVVVPVRASLRNPVYGGSLYKMPNEDRPSWGVHGGAAYLTARGKKIVDFIKDNEAEFTNFATKKFGTNGKWTVRTAVEYASSNSDDAASLGTLSSHEASGNFSDIADLYTEYADYIRYKRGLP